MGEVLSTITENTNAKKLKNTGNTKKIYSVIKILINLDVVFMG